MRMDKDICKVMFNEVELQGVCKRLGEQITKDYEGKDLLIVGILNGAIVFVTDLMRQIDRQIKIFRQTINPEQVPPTIAKCNTAGRRLDNGTKRAPPAQSLRLLSRCQQTTARGGFAA